MRPEEGAHDGANNAERGRAETPPTVPARKPFFKLELFMKLTCRLPSSPLLLSKDVLRGARLPIRLPRCEFHVGLGHEFTCRDSEESLSELLVLRIMRWHGTDGCCEA
jgi:hypothetical protein